MYVHYSAVHLYIHVHIHVHACMHEQHIRMYSTLHNGPWGLSVLPRPGHGVQWNSVVFSSFSFVAPSDACTHLRGAGLTHVQRGTSSPLRTLDVATTAPFLSISGSKSILYHSAPEPFTFSRGLGGRTSSGLSRISSFWRERGDRKCVVKYTWVNKTTHEVYSYLLTDNSTSEA